ncbi:hypothetical protein HNY73_017203 [Argiope bruennichi]|uniref:Uncharacterized protein n=1 Tax=Argiope bruennichi TaxID=94029 RepID=A0A8T0EQ62_ARGBR|nr:hypothetical protein HNY73_017203 [Argiope bruennichi]
MWKLVKEPTYPEWVKYTGGRVGVIMGVGGRWDFSGTVWSVMRLRGDLHVFACVVSTNSLLEKHKMAKLDKQTGNLYPNPNEVLSLEPCTSVSKNLSENREKAPKDMRQKLVQSIPAQTAIEVESCSRRIRSVRNEVLPNDSLS